MPERARKAHQGHDPSKSGSYARIVLAEPDGDAIPDTEVARVKALQLQVVTQDGEDTAEWCTIYAQRVEGELHIVLIDPDDQPYVFKLKRPPRAMRS